ncbi:CbiX/SirB N-terminal domain-containing protein [Paenibacillus aurantius]|uniref:CbiX/SirB N-terminal domain-containing protein n=1 Tax=Paenibacillus aurantius TaxID=2918900 RepID=A0AA96LHP8_9BACL|nr:CbiX/SirB N-terminal domain-containing protein [Paenibacillus aurantius]WNQ12196.1 CbiX/SirB N-terminal domain-containing protein [Paenibacillus aurantius]
MQKYGLLVISHGSRSAEWVGLVDDAVAAVRMPEDVPVSSSFLEIVEGRLIQDGIDELERQGVTDLVVVPLFVSSGSTHIDEIAYALGVQPEPSLETDLEPFRIEARVHFASPIDDDPDVARMLYANLAELSADPAKEAVLLVGHGSKEKGFHRRWREGLRKLAERLKEQGGFAEAGTAMLLPDQLACQIRSMRKRKPDLAVIVSPLFLSEGYFTKTVIPSRLEGLEYRYNGRALLPNPLVSRWIEKQAAAFLPHAALPSEEQGTGALPNNEIRVINEWPNVQD